MPASYQWYCAAQGPLPFFESQTLWFSSTKSYSTCKIRYFQFQIQFLSRNCQYRLVICYVRRKEPSVCYLTMLWITMIIWHCWWMDKRLSMEHWWNHTDMTDWYLSTRWKTSPSATLPTTNPTQAGLGLNPGLHCDGRVTNCLSHSTAQRIVKQSVYHKIQSEKLYIMALPSHNYSKQGTVCWLHQQVFQFSTGLPGHMPQLYLKLSHYCLLPHITE